MDLPFLSSLGWTRENPEKRNNEAETQVRLEVVVWLTATGGGQCSRTQICRGLFRDVDLHRR
jgi:hypothetical protein